jgi:YebC/PmpR family DNA-binding regulatory protein
MSGHSKWSTIKRKKGVADARRGQLFTKLGKEIELAARAGADPEFNFKLRLMIDKAKANNMPRENIERAVRRGAGLEKGAAQLEEITYEGYGPHGVAIVVKVLTDNRNRSVAEVRRILTRAGGSLGETGCVAWLFDQRGYISLPVDGRDPDEVAMAAIDAGAEDFEIGSGQVDVYTRVEDLGKVREALQDKGLEIDAFEITMQPKTTISLDEENTLKVMNIIESLEELDDVQQVFSNLEIPDELLSKLEAE